MANVVYGEKCPSCSKIMSKDRRHKGAWICRHCGEAKAARIDGGPEQSWFTGETEPKRYRRRS